jgi:CheY-like chemotaxis protein
MQTEILYVEDNPDHAELVLRHLEQRALRARTIHLEDGELALEYLGRVARGAAAAPSLVLLDLRLPRVDGMAVLDHIKSTSSLREIPVVVFTTSTTQRDVQDAYAHHANSYLVKPDEPHELNALLDELSHYWLDRNRKSKE